MQIPALDDGVKNDRQSRLQRRLAEYKLKKAKELEDAGSRTDSVKDKD
jgi:hypothetical protein